MIIVHCIIRFFLVLCVIANPILAAAPHSHFEEQALAAQGLPFGARAPKKESSEIDRQLTDRQVPYRPILQSPTAKLTPVEDPEDHRGGLSGKNPLGKLTSAELDAKAIQMIEGLGWPMPQPAARFIADAKASDVVHKEYGDNFQDFVTDISRPRSSARRWVVTNKPHYAGTEIFREPTHFKFLEDELPTLFDRRQQSLLLVSAGTSDGREALSMGAVLWGAAQHHPEWSDAENIRAKVVGVEIHPELVLKANAYLNGDESVPTDSPHLRGTMLAGNGRTQLPQTLLERLNGWTPHGAKIAAEQLFKDSAADLPKLVAFEEMSLLDPEVLLLISAADAVFMHFVAYQMTPSARRILKRALMDMRPQSYIFGDGGFVTDFDLDVVTQFEVVPAAGGTILRRRGILSPIGGRNLAMAA